MKFFSTIEKAENAEEKFDFVTDLTNGWDRRKTDKVHALKLNFALKLLLFSFAAAKNPTIYNTIRLFAGPMGQTTRRPII